MAGHDHGAAGEKRVAGGNAAPENASVPDRRALLRIQLFADRGVNAVGRDQQRAVMAARRSAGCLVDEVGADTARRLRPAVKMMAGENVFGPQPFGRGVEQNLLQRAAMDRKLRPFVTGLDATGLAPDRLAVLEKYASSLVRTPDASSRSSRPSSISSRTACGSRLMPTPSGFNSETLSNTLAGTPI